MDIQIQQLHSRARLPEYAHVGDAGMDLFSVETVNIAAGERTVVPTGLAMAIPEGYVGLVWDKSGIAVTSGLTTLAGVIDAGYRGEIKIAVLNTSKKEYVCEAGQKIAQLLIQPVVQPTIVESNDLSVTERGQGGFGSTGLQ